MFVHVAVHILKLEIHRLCGFVQRNLLSSPRSLNTHVSEAQNIYDITRIRLCGQICSFQRDRGEKQILSQSCSTPTPTLRPEVKTGGILTQHEPECIMCARRVMCTCHVLNPFIQADTCTSIDIRLRRYCNQMRSESR
jgi:hypothetical protein